MNGRTLKACIWARVSTTEQDTSEQLRDMQAMAEGRGLEVVQVIDFDDSAYTRSTGANGKGAEFDRKRAMLTAGAQRGEYQVVIIWALDRLTRRGARDTLNYIEGLAEICEVWSFNEPWVETLRDPIARPMLLSAYGAMAQQESKRRSERAKLGNAKRRRAGLPLGMAAAKALELETGQKRTRGPDRKPRSGHSGSGWTDERRAALAERNRLRAEADRQAKAAGHE